MIRETFVVIGFILVTGASLFMGRCSYNGDKTKVEIESREEVPKELIEKYNDFEIEEGGEND